MKPLTKTLLSLIEKPYDQYNAVLPEIKGKIEAADAFGSVRVSTFEQVLGEELPFSTARRAYRTAVLVAMGEPVVREYKPSKPDSKAPNKKH